MIIISVGIINVDNISKNIFSFPLNLYLAKAKPTNGSKISTDIVVNVAIIKLFLNQSRNGDVVRIFW